ncbi:glycosyltransferase [Solirhodobacter olei]|uniref:glycosyltransferase n=1 Tax=Solirhodobacter olei TaxID=2493082 RepID=UPI0013E346D8|nr:glycosyltransferase [Solirhodobacter olei]
MRAPVSVVIAVTNGEAMLARQFSVLGEALADGLIREVIVVDGGSKDGTLELAEAAGAVILKDSPVRAEALQRGIAGASGEWLLIPAPDTLPAPGWTEGLLRHLETAAGTLGRLPARPAGGGLWNRLRPGRPWLLMPQALASGPAAAMGRGVRLK